ncbi:hypothetical protein FD755_025730, partial [Muntiacus reevesi]
SNTALYSPNFPPPNSVYEVFLVAEPELEDPRQEMGVEKIEGELGDGPDMKGKTPPNVVPANIPEGGDGQ